MNNKYLRISIIIFFLLLFVFMDIHLINNLGINYLADKAIIGKNPINLQILKHNYEVYRQDGLESIKIFLNFTIFLVILTGFLSALYQFMQSRQKQEEDKRDNQFVNITERASSENEMSRINALVTLPVLSQKRINIDYKEYTGKSKYLEEFYQSNPYIRETLDILSYTLCKESRDKIEKLRLEHESSEISEINLSQLYKITNCSPTLIERACTDAISRITVNTLEKEVLIDNKKEWISAIDLDDKQLIGVFLEWTNLAGASLRRTNLMYSSLYNSNLSRADMKFSYLGGVNLSIADLSGADLSNAFLTNADLRDTYLCDCNLGTANLSGVNLRSADLLRANFSNCLLFRANLFGAYHLPESLKTAKSLDQVFINEENYKKLHEDIKEEYELKMLSEMTIKDLAIPEHFLIPLKDSFLKEELMIEFANLDLENILKRIAKMNSREVFAENAGIMVIKK